MNPAPGFIQTYTQRSVYLANPKPEDIDLRDIAHALARINRFTGHTQWAISVAEHSLHVCDLCLPHLKKWGLLHDAAEAYLGDVSRPLKRLLGPAYHDLETKFIRAIEDRFGVLKQDVSEYDQVAMLTEVRDAGPFGLAPEVWQRGTARVADPTFSYRKNQCLSAFSLESAFLRRCSELGIK